MSDQYLKDLVNDISKITEEYDAFTNSEILEREDTFRILSPVQNSGIEPVRNEVEVTFEYQTCYLCNGYYGPCFDDPLCATCHAFLYPNVLPFVEVPSSIDQKSDSDSGNDEPVESAFRNNGPENAVMPFLHDEARPSRVYDGELASPSNGAPLPERDFFPLRLTPVVVDNLKTHLERLSISMQHLEVINIELLPTEVLIHTFQYLDDISLWSISQVCSRWRSILFMYVKPERWKQFVIARWPLLPVISLEQDWYKLYTAMMRSSCCFKCVQQMAAQELPPNWDENQWRGHRLRTELRVMRTDPLDGIEAIPLDSACCHWQATLEGPAGSSYEGGLFFLYIQIPASYPLHPPIVRFITKIFHPNISRHGDIGIDSIHQNWSLALTMSKLLISIQSLLTDPFCEACMEPEIGRLYLENRKAFEEQATLWSAKYAMNDLVLH